MKIDAIFFSKYLIRTTTVLIGLAAVLFIFSDIYAPFTTQSQIEMPTSNVHPQVSGNIIHINIKNGQPVSKGDLLYSIDSKEFALHVKSAEANLIAAKSELESLNAQLLINYSLLEQQKAIYQQSLSHFNRFSVLYKKKQISIEQYEQAKSDKESKFQIVQQKQAEVQKTISKIGPEGENPNVLQAQSALAYAQLNLDRTNITSGGNGFVSNIQISIGDFVESNTNTLVIVDAKKQYLKANFNEKGLEKLVIGSPVLIVFDAYPGSIYEGQVTSLDKAIQSGVGQVGKLTQTNESERWIRKSEQFPVRIKILNPPKNLIAGSKATVMAKRSDNTFWKLTTSFYMRMIATLRYVY